MTVYAKWNTANQTPQFKVTFNTNEGAASTSTEKAVTAAGTVESMPSNPTRTGYTFEGWNTAQDGGGTAFTATTPVTGNTTVYAKWKSANPLIGAWMSPDSTSPSHFVVFTDSTMYFSYAIVRSSPRTTFINTALSTIKLTDNNGYEKTYNYQLAGNKLVVKKFANDNDMTFKRREGSKKTGIEDLWIPEDLSSENQWTYLLLIRETGQGNDVLYNYRIGDYWSMDTYTYEPASSGGRIQWTNLSSTPTSFNLSEDRKTLRISLPSLSSYTGQELTFVSTTWY
ncbi:MAG: InlB B-repeat-containing protein [Spirochaetaceae bacterium]|nr:InlB B-repeat-containing protein [Spirochaetaceae bacterium]